MERRRCSRGVTKLSRSVQGLQGSLQNSRPARTRFGMAPQSSRRNTALSAYLPLYQKGCDLPTIGHVQRRVLMPGRHKKDPLPRLTVPQAPRLETGFTPFICQTETQEG